MGVRGSCLSDFQEFLDRFAHDTGVRFRLRPDLEADDSLIYQHAESVQYLTASVCSRAQQPSLRRIDDDVGDNQTRVQ